MLLGKMKSRGGLATKLIRNVPLASISWRLKNWLTWKFISNYVFFHLASKFTKLTGISTHRGKLSAVLYRDGKPHTNFGVIGYGVVTAAFVNFLAANLEVETSEFGDFKFHDSGVGTTAATNGDTDIETTDAEARVTGDQNSSTNTYTSVGTITYTSTLDITEHGIFSIITGGTMMDRHVFAAIGVVNTDQIEFTYTYTATAET